MMGAIIGDIVGSIYEFNNHRSKEFPLFGKGCFPTDDSIMTIAIGQALVDYQNGLQKDLSDAAIARMTEIGRFYPACGFGGRFFNWIFGNEHKPYNSFGNGAAMRVSGVVGCDVTLEEALKLSDKVTEISHNHPEGIRGARATVELAWGAKNGYNLAELTMRARKYYKRDFLGEFRCDNIRKNYRFNETCQETVPQAIEAFLEATSFEDAIRNAISLGGDSDTLAAITGTIAEWYFGIPENMAIEATRYLDDRLLDAFESYVDEFAGNNIIFED